jgi:hypothetical protein
MAKIKHKEHAKKHSKAKSKEASIDNNSPYENELRKVVSHAFSSGWVQNSGIGFALILIALIGAIMTSTQVKAAAITTALAGTLFLWILAGVVIKYATESKPNEPKVVYFGGLSPGNEPVLALPPGSPANTVQLLLGDDLRILSASSNPVFSRNGKSFLSIGSREGLIRLTATILDTNNQSICRIIDNEFQAFPERAFNPKQPDEHSLIVRDREGIEVLNIQFRNPTTIWLIGRFQIPGTTEPVLVMRDEGIRWPGGGGIGHLTLDMTQSKGGAIGF